MAQMVRAGFQSLNAAERAVEWWKRNVDIGRVFEPRPTHIDEIPCPDCRYDLRGAQPEAGSRIIICPECGGPANSDLLWLDNNRPSMKRLWFWALWPAMLIAMISLLIPHVWERVAFLLYLTVMLGGLPMIALALGHAFIIQARTKAAFLHCGTLTAPFWPALVAFGADMAAMILIGRAIIACWPRC